MDGGHIALGAFLDPLDRHAELARDGQADRLLGVDVELGAEGPADVRGDDAELRLGDAEGEREQGAQDVRDLGRRPHRHLARDRHRLGEHPARLHGVGDQPWVVVALLHGHRRLGEHLVDVAGNDLQVLEADVVAELLVDDRGAFGERLLDGGHDRQLLVVNLDRLGGVDRVLAGVGDHHGDRVTGHADLVPGDRPVGRDPGLGGDRPSTGQPGGPVRGQVGAAVGGDHAGQLQGGRGVHSGDAGVRHGTAHHGHPDHAGQDEVVEEVAVPGDEEVVLLAEHPRADVSARLDGGLGQRADGVLLSRGLAWERSLRHGSPSSSSGRTAHGPAALCYRLGRCW